MDINRLSDLEKSVLLARMMGWEVYETREAYFEAGMPHATEYDVNIEHPAYFYQDHRTSCVLPDFYTEVNMALAWRVLNWFEEQRKVGLSKRAFWFGWGDFEVWMRREPAVAQRRWLDKVLELMIEERDL